ncbi:MAG: hypothetical protein KOO64_04730 [Desulfobacterales bacterium]|nr:hypothetical protein [Desulfobacterales bacterium]
MILPGTYESCCPLGSAVVVMDFGSPNEIVNFGRVFMNIRCYLRINP